MAEKTIVGKDTCTPMFVAALFTIARRWRQLRCPLTEEWKQIFYFILFIQQLEPLAGSYFSSYSTKHFSSESIKK